MRQKSTPSNQHISRWAHALAIVLSLVLLTGTTPLAFAEEVADALPDAPEAAQELAEINERSDESDEPASSADVTEQDQLVIPVADQEELVEVADPEAVQLEATPADDATLAPAEDPAAIAAEDQAPMLAESESDLDSEQEPEPYREDISGYTIVLNSKVFWYTGKPVCPKPTVYDYYYDDGDGWIDSGSIISPSCYTVSYANNVSAGTATITVTGTGSYTGTIRKTFPIRYNLAQATATAIKAKTYNGKAFTPTPAMTLAGRRLTKGTDYTISYKSNKKAGTAKVIITGKGTCAGSKTLTFKIKKKSLKKAKVAKIADKRCTGKSIKPKPKVKVGKTKLKKGRDYTLSYKRNKDAGTATIINKGKGNYSGKKKVTFRIVGSAPRSGSSGSTGSGQSQTVYRTRTGDCYHRDGCRYLSKSKIPISRAEAEARFRPCKVCRP